MKIIRYLGSSLAAVLAATLLSAAPAWAAVSDTPGGDRAGWYAGSSRSLYPPCVTTTWRAAYWNTDKTRIGQRCYKADRATWIPKAWPRVGYVVVRGELRPVYQRTV